MLDDQKKKGELIVYAMDKLGSYISHQGEAVPYGLEYLVSGKSSQKDAFASVVSRLFTMRALINFLYVEKDPILLSQSLETATALAATLMAEAFIPVIQHGILLVLAMEEACVDVTALLLGRRVPVLKNQSSFQMKYAQICTAGKALPASMILPGLFLAACFISVSIGTSVGTVVADRKSTRLNSSHAR